MRAASEAFGGAKNEMTQHSGQRLTKARQTAAEKSVEDLKHELWQICELHGGKPIEASLRDLDKAPSIRLDADQFAIAIAIEHPKALFWWEVVLDDDWLESELVATGWSKEDAEDPDSEWPTLAQAKSRLAPQLYAMQAFVQRPYFLMCLYTVDGIARAMIYQAPWYGQFEEDVEDMLELHHAVANRAQDEAESANAAVIDLLIDEIAGREDFKSVKGLPKRALFVQELYGEKIPRHSEGRFTRLRPHLELMDLNLAHVIKTADERTWLAKTLKMRT